MAYKEAIQEIFQEITMTTIKLYTDIEQSKKLAAILSPESADMCWTKYIDNGDITSLHATVNYGIVPIEYPCWSLAALLGALPTIDDEFEPQLHRSLDKYCCTYEGEEDSSGLWRVADNPVDACVAMIEKLHELNLL